MPSQTLTESIQQAITQGQTKEQIYTELIKAGFKIDEINKSYLNFLQPNPKKEHENHLSASKILLSIGGLVTVLGGIIYIGINWRDWNEWGRIFAILLPLLVLYIVGIPLWLNKTYQKQAIAFIFTGSLLFPLFLTVTFLEFKIYKDAFNSFGFAISLLSLIFYLLESLVFSSPIWGFLSPAAALFVYYFGLEFLGSDRLFHPSTKVWAYLLPSIIYILLSFYYQKNGLIERAKYPFLIGVAVSIFSLFYILVSSFRREFDSWLLFIPIVIYFLIAALFEKHDQKENSLALYTISLLTLFANLIRLALEGSILKPFKELLSSYTLIGGSVVIVGIIYLLLSYFLPKLKQIGLEKPAKFTHFFESMGTLAFLGGIFQMGLGGRKLVYETLLLISSVGFIFASILNQSRSFLYIGTLFLIVYIFSIGGEYFQNQVGWPLTLFITGLLSMGIGFVIEKLRRQYFQVADKR